MYFYLYYITFLDMVTYFAEAICSQRLPDRPSEYLPFHQHLGHQTLRDDSPTWRPFRELPSGGHLVVAYLIKLLVLLFVYLLLLFVIGVKQHNYFVDKMLLFPNLFNTLYLIPSGLIFF